MIRRAAVSTVPNARYGRFITRKYRFDKERVMKVVINDDLCIACGECVDLCPKKILYIDESADKCRCRDEKKCDGLRGCEKVCPVEAIKIYDS